MSDPTNTDAATVNTDAATTDTDAQTTSGPAGADVEYPDGSKPPVDPDTGLPLLEDRRADFPDVDAVEVEAEPVLASGRRLGATSGMSAYRGLAAKRRERGIPVEEPTAPVAPDTDEERQAALAAAAEKGYSEADLVDSDGNPLDVAGIYRSLEVEQTPEGSQEATGDAGTSEDSSTGENDAETGGDGSSEQESSEAETPEEPEESADEGYGPEAHTVAEVQAYLSEHPDQATYVLDRERAGKARVSLIGA